MKPELGDIIRKHPNKLQVLFGIKPKKRIVTAIYPLEGLVYVSDLKDINCKRETKLQFSDLEYDLQSRFYKISQKIKNI